MASGLASISITMAGRVSSSALAGQFSDHREIGRLTTAERERERERERDFGHGVQREKPHKSLLNRASAVFVSSSKRRPAGQK